MRRATLGMVAMVVSLSGVGCGGARDDGAEVGPLDVEIVVELRRGHAFTATGAAVDAGLFCESGHQWEIGFFDVDGETRLTAEEWVPRLREAQRTGGAIVAYVFESQLACADGSGRIEITDDPLTWWEVRQGVGEYEGVLGEGTSTLALGGPDHPPEDGPLSVTFTGSLRRAGP